MSYRATRREVKATRRSELKADVEDTKKKVAQLQSAYKIALADLMVQSKPAQSSKPVAVAVAVAVAVTTVLKPTKLPGNKTSTLNAHAAEFKPSSSVTEIKPSVTLTLIEEENCYDMYDGVPKEYIDFASFYYGGNYYGGPEDD